MTHDAADAPWRPPNGADPNGADPNDAGPDDVGNVSGYPRQAASGDAPHAGAALPPPGDSGTGLTGLPTPTRPAQLAPSAAFAAPTLPPPVAAPNLPPPGAADGRAAPGVTPVLPPVVPPAARAPLAPPTPAGPPTGPPPPGPPPVLEFHDPAAAEPPRRRSRKLLVGAVASVFAIGAAGTFAVAQFAGDDDGGANSPVSVGEEMMEALANEDLLGVVDLLLPGERDTFREPLIDMVDELARLEVLAPDATLADLSGLDIVLDDRRVVATPTNVDDITNINMLATMSATVRGQELPLGALTLELFDEFGGDITELDEQATDLPFDVPMTVVEQDGRWYLSVFYTAAEEAREGAGSPDVPVAGITPRGGDTPEDAIALLIDGVERLDARQLIELLDPQEAEALQRYAPLFIDEAEAALADAPLQWQITDVSYTVDGSGSTRSVTIDRLAVEGTFEGAYFDVRLDGRCVSVTTEGETFDSCDAAFLQELDELFAGAEPLRDLIATIEAAFADYEHPGIIVEQVGGEWFVSPIGTGFEQILAVLRALDRQELDAIIHAVENFIDWYFGQLFGGGGPLLGGDPFLDDQFPDEPYAEDGTGGGVEIVEDESVIEPPTEPSIEPSVGEPGSGEVEDEFEQQQRIASECFALSTLDGVTTCLTDAVDAGLIPDYYLGVELRYPECGVGEIAIGLAPLYELSDAAYTELITNAAECFNGLIASGELDEFDVPVDYLRPECSEGRNPWNLGVDDDGLFDRWLDCVYS